MKEIIIREIDRLAPRMKEISKAIYEKPELGFEEFAASKLLIDFLKEGGFDVEENVLGMPTAFIATKDSGKEGRKVGFLAEYDALPGIGHGCGHNMIGVMSCAAGIALSKALDQVGGKVVVFGTPAEETSGTKVDFAEKGFFDDMDAAFMAHPIGSGYFHSSGESMGLHALKFEYKGVSAHAAAEPYAGKNALDGLINTFNGINALRQQMRTNCRIHGIVRDGGRAANIIPDYASGEFYVRSYDPVHLEDLLEKVKNCARAGALAAGVELEISFFEKSYKSLMTNEVLSQAYDRNLKEIGGIDATPPRDSGSSDIGDVSQRCPAIHPYFNISEKGGIVAHSKEMAIETQTEYAKNSMIMIAKVLAATGLDILTDPVMADAMMAEFKERFPGVRK